MTGIGGYKGIKGRVALAAGVMGMGLLSGPAQAALYNWTFMSDPPGFNSSGQFEETAGVITAFSGTWMGVAIDTLEPPGTLDGNDNLFPVTGNGVAFSLVDPLPGGDSLIRLLDIGGVPSPHFWVGANLDDFGYGTFSATSAVPEPASAAILGAAVVGLLASARRRRVKAAAAA